MALQGEAKKLYHREYMRRQRAGLPTRGGRNAEGDGAVGTARAEDPEGVFLTSLSPLAALTNRRRLFVNLLRGMTRFRCDRYRWSSICARHDGLGKDFIGGRFGEASTQS